MKARVSNRTSITRIAALTLFLASCAAVSSALAQGGSAGGSIGATEKTLSGQRHAVAPAAPLAHRPGGRRTETEPKRSAAGSRCQAVVGSWAFSNGVGVFFKAGGGLSSTTGDGGTWSCDNGMVQAHWARWTDHYLVSSDGGHITGNSGLLNMALTATKN